MTITTQVMHESATHYTMKRCSDTTAAGETDAVIIDVSALSPAAVEVDLLRLWYSAVGQTLLLEWDATVDTLATTLPANTSGHIDLTKILSGGIRNNAGAGKTGDLLLTVAAGAGSYSLIIESKKRLQAEV